MINVKKKQLFIHNVNGDGSKNANIKKEVIAHHYID